MTSLYDFFQFDLALQALLASMMVGAVCGVLGCFIVLRNMSLIGDALSHAILPGIVVAFALFGYSTPAFFIGSMVAGLFSAFLITWLQQKIRVKNDAAIGIIFTWMFSAGVIGISWLSKHEGVHLDLKDFLFGNILSVSREDVWMTLITALLVIAGITLFFRHLFITTFQPVLAQTMGINPGLIHYLLMLMLSFTVVASLRTVGVILVVAMLITPASTALLLSDKLKQVILLSFLIGIISAITGLIGSILLDAPPGPVMAIVTAIIYFITIIFSPKRGLLRKWWDKKLFTERVLQEDILKYFTKQPTLALSNTNILSDTLDKSFSKIKSGIQYLIQSGLLEIQQNNYILTPAGTEKARGLVRAHRLWESYLVKEVGLGQDQIHDDAERMEHALSTDFLDRVDERLGFPDTDPHGEPIPAKSNTQTYLSLIPRHQEFIINKALLSAESIKALEQLKFQFDITSTVIQKEQKYILVKQDKLKIKIPIILAARIQLTINN